MGEDALDDGAPGVDPLFILEAAPDYLVEHVVRPAVEAGLDNAEGGVEAPASWAAQYGLEALITGAKMQGVRERRCFCAGLTGEATEPGHALAGGVADGRPERPSIGSGLIASCAASSALTASRRRRFYSGHMLKAGRIVKASPAATFVARLRRAAQHPR